MTNMSALAAQDSEYAFFNKNSADREDVPARANVLNALKETGAVICRGYLDTMEDFVRFSNQFIRTFVPYVGGANNGRATVGGDNSIYTVTEPSMKTPLPLHAEMYYMAAPPELLWFYCRTPAAADGETTLCDGRKILAGLSPRTRREFEEREVIYCRNFSSSVWRQVYQTDNIENVEAFCRANQLNLVVKPDGGITTTYRASAIVRSPGGSAFVNSILNFAAQEYFTGSNESQVRWSNNDKIDRDILVEVKTVSDRLTHAHAWQPGDAILLDNSRVMHGRRAFHDDQRDIVVRLGMLDA
jgi:alpha-ketoglutarate-dependent taurine dioxygenase